MVRAWNENSFADSVLLICKIAAPGSGLIPGCGASAASAARPAHASPISPKANSPKAVLKSVLGAKLDQLIASSLATSDAFRPAPARIHAERDSMILCTVRAADFGRTS